tara:strand:- start:7795 stop:8670 length:876 start_codon:yes stop_codon:yes gene_type:complete
VITTIIFSKDRPLQLDLCLKSINKNLVGSDAITVTVIENYSEKYLGALETLQSEHPEVNFIKQHGSNLFKCIWAYLSTQPQDYPVAFFTDDGILFKEQDVKSIIRVMRNPNVVTYSMRMGLNVRRREHQGVSYPDTVCPSPEKTQVDRENRLVIWNKTVSNYGNYWSYSHSVDGHVFRYSDIFDWTDTLATLSCHKKIRCKTPNDYESGLQMFWCSTVPWMVSSLESSYVNSPNNRVSDNFHENSSGDTHYCSPDKMLDLYEEGKRIKLLNVPIPHIDCPHTEIDIMKGVI